jgi:S-DNA-T family DNA segregation ATPase FtsK/SpoIIIE
MTEKERKAAAKRSRLLGLLLLICGLLIGISLVTHSQSHDTTLLLNSFSAGKIGDLFSTPLANKGGVLGVIIAYILLMLFGYLALFLPVGIWALSYGFFFIKDIKHMLKKIGIAGLFLYLIGLLFSLGGAKQAFITGKPGAGGALGHFSASLLIILTGTVISYTIVISLILGWIIWVLPSDFGKHLKSLKGAFDKCRSTVSRPMRTIKAKKQPETKTETKSESFFAKIIRIKKPKKKSVYTIEKPDLFGEPEPAEKTADVNLNSTEKAGTVSTKLKTDENGYALPDLNLLNDPPENEPLVTQQELHQTAEVLKDTLGTFGVELANREVEIYPGPVITRFEFKPAPGVKIVRVVNLADDLALAMKAKRIRIVAPIPGKSAIGVEIPNRVGKVVYLKDSIKSDEFQKSEYMLPLALGKTISGKPFVVDLASMPHLLIAGATGSGKSVCLNCIITSLLYKLSPDILRFILIDPKMLELTAYNDLPHLEKPVVTEMKYAEKVLAESVVEMEDRYRRLAKTGVRNIKDFNEASKEPLPYVVIIVDELADLMMIGSTRIETLVTRLAQMARAVGIHLILATQRPSVDVITGLIKANFSTRIAFQVATKVDSRTILDLNGAEKLIGRGDMLYMNPAFAEPKRVHGAFISSAETKAICKFVGDQEYQAKPIKNFENSSTAAQYDPAGDAVFREAVKLVIKHKQGSVSLLQRRLGVGYQRAARLIDQLEEAGIVGPYDGSKAREVLVDEQYLREHYKDYADEIS